MKPVRLALPVLALATFLAVACGGSDKGDLRVRQGLAAASLSPGGPAAPELKLFQVGASAGGDRGGGLPTNDALLQQSQAGITVQGFGSATAQADRAVLELFFEGRFSGADGAAADAGLQPVVDALIFRNVPHDEINVIGSPKYEPYSSGAPVTVRATIHDVGALGDIVEDVTEAAKGPDRPRLTSINILYAVADCAAMDQAAIQAAVQDARGRGALFAEALGVQLGPVLGASHYAYSNFGPNPCDPAALGPYSVGGQPYAPGQPAEVQISANVTITFAIQ